MTCKNCGAELKEGMTFCSKCGTNNAQPQQAPKPVSGSQVQPQPQQMPQGGFTNQQQFTNPQPNYYTQPVMAAPKKPIEKTILGLRLERLAVISAIIVGVLYVLSGFIGMFYHINTYGTSVSGMLTSLISGIAEGILWATVIILLAKIMSAVCGNSGKSKGK